MAALTLTVDELRHHPTGLLGSSGWIMVDQKRTNLFAEATGEDHWTHTDPERATRESPFGRTTAQGFLTLSLITFAMRDIIEISDAKTILNYGLDRVRFTAPVFPPSRLRLHQHLVSATGEGQGRTKVKTHCEIEIADEERPAVVADFLFLVLS